MIISEANSWKQIKRFIDFPHTLYAGDPNYVPEIYLAQKEMFDVKKNPFFKHSNVQLFLAEDQGKVVGRIAAIHNVNYNNYTNKNVGFFGFFDVIEDYNIASQLLQVAEKWLKSKNLDGIIGPTNFSTNDTAGLLIKGFDRPAVYGMTYNRPYYQDFLERFGFGKSMDLLAYLITSQSVNQRSLDLSARLEERLQKRGITVRNVNMKKFKAEVREIKEIYEGAWDKNWGFVPPTSAEFDNLADGLKMIVNPDYISIAEHDGKPIGFAVAIPDINEIMRTIKRGRLLPFGIFKLLWRKNKVKRIRILLLGVLEDYRRMGIEGVFYANIIRNGLKNGVTEAEASWILEDNEMMNKGILSVGGEAYKRYRIFEKTLSDT